MGDRSKIEGRRAEAARKFEESTNAKPDANVVRCRACKKSQREVPIMIEMGGFVFCSECITAAYGLVAGGKAGRILRQTTFRTNRTSRTRRSRTRFHRRLRRAGADHHNQPAGRTPAP